MKMILVFLMILCVGVIAWFFIKEQFQGMVLSHNENMLLSATYLILGISFFLFARIRAKKIKGNQP